MKERFIIDTQVFLWLANEPQKISKAALQIIETPSVLLLSHVSIWEISIKTGLGKLKIDFQLEDFLNKATEKHAIEYLPITLKAIFEVQNLPLHHKDPFDRLLIATAKSEEIQIISSDSIFDSYSAKRIW
jgi:PIN domain nuclease of toxin-antitoxin system